MKSFYFLLGMALVFGACKKKRADIDDRPVTKQIAFHVYAVHDYSTGIPRGSYTHGSVRLTIEELNSRTDVNRIIWDTTMIERTLDQFPLHQQRYVIQKAIGVKESEAGLFVKYEKVYTRPFHAPQRFGGGELMPKGQQNLQMNVEL